MHDHKALLESTTAIAVALAANMSLRESGPGFTIASIYAQLAATAGPAAPEATEETPTAYEPAVTSRKSLASPDHIISMIDGKPYKTLRRHLATHGMTPAEYRERYGLKADYPMVAPTYSEARRNMAKRIGLRRKPSSTKNNG
jgi:predicted transcriptional regulator